MSGKTMSLTLPSLSRYVLFFLINCLSITNQFIFQSASKNYSEGIKRNQSLIVCSTSNNKRQCTGNDIIESKRIDVDNMEITKTPKPNLSLSSVSGLTPETKTETSLSMQCSETWMKIQECLRLEEKENKKRIEFYVKHHLFKDLKFIFR